MIVINDTITIPDSELGWNYARSSGPGGQNVNKVASKVQLRWAFLQSEAIPEAAKGRIRRARSGQVTTEGELLIVSQKTRDQEKNRADCLEKLAEIVRAALVEPKVRKRTRPSYASKQRRLDTKKRQSQKKAGRQSPGFPS